jgi:diguanylate cyclase (GGDEF)-like protein/PAS domain S-box-containing protein
VVSRIEFAAKSQESIVLDYPHQDELGRLVVAMETMQRRLSAAHEQLAHVNQELEQTVAQRTRHLTEALTFNEAVLLNSPLPMGVYAASGQCVRANEAYAQLVGASREALLGQNFHQIRVWQETGLLVDSLAALAQHCPQQREVHGVTSFGKELWLESRILPTQLNGQDHLLVQFVDLTERKRLENELRHLAFHDPLTQLPNRRLLMDRLAQALRTSKRQNSYGAVLFLDLNQFKPLNDSHGHAVGDLLLIEVALRLQQAVRDRDTVARLGGDEFLVLLEGLGASHEQALEDARTVADKINTRLSEPYQLGDLLYQGSVSLGLKLFDGCSDAAQILKAADAAMYQAKRGDRR